MGQSLLPSTLQALRRAGARGAAPARRRRLRGLLLRAPLVTLFLAGVGAVSLLVQAAVQLGGLRGLDGDGALAALLLPHAAPPRHAARPLFVVAGGAPRTGSTFIFNVLRVLLRVRDPNTVASSNWMLAKLVPEHADAANASAVDRVALLRSLGTTVVVKVHTARQYYAFAGPGAAGRRFADDVDLLVTSFRDLRDESVSAFKMFARNRSAYAAPAQWAGLCQALIRRRDSLIKEAGAAVPVEDVRYEDWRDGSDRALLRLIRRLAARLDWPFTEDDFRSTLREVKRLRVPLGGAPDTRIDWHLSNLMSPRHISVEKLSEEFIQRGVQAVEREPVCNDWLVTKGYLS